MDRYKVFQAWENIDTDPNGEWVKYSDAQTEIDRLKAHVRAINSSMDHHAASAAALLSTKISEIDKLQARVRELEEVIRTMAKGDDYISPEELDDILKGTP